MKTWQQDRRVWVGAALLVAGIALVWFMAARAGNGEDEHSSHTEISTVTSAESIAEETVWTCSMHPQIRENRPGKCPICGMELIPLTSGPVTGPVDPARIRMSPEAAALAEVRTARAELASPSRVVELDGVISADERALRTIPAEFAGRVERLYADFTGQVVRAGEPLVSLHSPTLLAAQRELIEAARLRETHPALHAAARARLLQWGVSAKQLDAVEASGQPAEVLDVVAPASGTVLQRFVSPGDYVGRGDPLFALADLGRVWAVFDAYEDDLGWLSRGDSLEVTVTGVPGRTFRVVASFVEPVLDARTRTGRVRAVINNSGGLLRPGQFARARVEGRTPASAAQLPRVPASAVLWTGPRSVVYVRVAGEADPVFEMREVTLGPSAGDHRFIAEGIKAGEEVVVHGTFAVDAAAQLAGRHSMLNRPAPVLSGEVPEAFARALSSVTNRYLDLQDALAEDRLDAARKAAATLPSAVGDAASVRRTGGVETVWREHGGALVAAAEALVRETSLEGMRGPFRPLSDALIALLDAIGSPQVGVRVNWCPMADNDRGAYWLDREAGVRNPYFGESMYTCGETQRTIPVRDAGEGARPSPAVPRGHVH